MSGARNGEPKDFLWGEAADGEMFSVMGIQESFYWGTKMVKWFWTNLRSQSLSFLTSKTGALGSPVAQFVKSLPVSGIPEFDPRLGRSPGEVNGYPSNILAWRTPWTEEPGRLHSIRLQRVGYDWANNITYRDWYKQQWGVEPCNLIWFLCFEELFYLLDID